MPVNAMHGEAIALRLEQASKVARQISVACNLVEAIQAIADSARDLTGADSCIIYLQRPNNGAEEFEMAASSPEEQYPNVPRFRGGLTEKIITENLSIIIPDTINPNGLHGVTINKEIIRTGIRSISGVPVVGANQMPVGVIYVNSKSSGKFSDIDVRVLQTLANFVPLAQGLSQPLLKLTEEAETAAEKLFEIESTARNFCEVVHQEFEFDFVALQVIDKAERSISTIYGTGVAREWMGLLLSHEYARHIGSLCHCFGIRDTAVPCPGKCREINSKPSARSIQRVRYSVGYCNG